MKTKTTKFRPGMCPSCSHPQHVDHNCNFVDCDCTKDLAIKADDGKPTGFRLFAWDGVPEVLEVYRYGLEKGYVRDSWRNVPPHKYEDALMRHCSKWLLGEENDPESGLRHLAHIAWNAMALIVLIPLKRKKNLY